jgi:hypothetical protein
MWCEEGHHPIRERWREKQRYLLVLQLPLSPTIIIQRQATTTCQWNKTSIFFFLRK